MVGGRYRLKHVTSFRAIQPPWSISSSWISVGLPGAHVICSTCLFWSSHVLAGIFFSSSSRTDPSLALMLLAGHVSRVGAKM